MLERGYWVSTLFVSKLKSTVVQGTQIWLELILKIFYFSIKLDCAPLHFVNVELKAVRVKSSPCSKFSDNLRVLLNPFNPRRESQDFTCHTNVPGKQPKRRLPHGNTLLMCIRSLLGALQNNTLLEIINLLLLMQRKTGSTASDGGNGEGRGVQNVAENTKQVCSMSADNKNLPEEALLIINMSVQSDKSCFSVTKLRAWGYHCSWMLHWCYSQTDMAPIQMYSNCGFILVVGFILRKQNQHCKCCS